MHTHQWFTHIDTSVTVTGKCSNNLYLLKGASYQQTNQITSVYLQLIIGKSGNSVWEIRMVKETSWINNKNFSKTHFYFHQNKSKLLHMLKKTIQQTVHIYSSGCCKLLILTISLTVQIWYTFINDHPYITTLRLHCIKDSCKQKQFPKGLTCLMETQVISLPSGIWSRQNLENL